MTIEIRRPPPYRTAFADWLAARFDPDERPYRRLKRSDLLKQAARDLNLSQETIARLLVRHCARAGRYTLAFDKAGEPYVKLKPYHAAA